VFVEVVVEFVHASVKPLPGVINAGDPFIITEFAHRMHCRHFGGKIGNGCGTPDKRQHQIEGDDNRANPACRFPRARARHMEQSNMQARTAGVEGVAPRACARGGSDASPFDGKRHVIHLLIV